MWHDSRVIANPQVFIFDVKGIAPAVHVEGEDCRREYPAYCFASHALRQPGKLPVVAIIVDDGIFAPGLSATIYIIHLSLA